MTKPQATNYPAKGGTRRRRQLPTRCAFTLVELLVVVGIVGILSTITGSVLINITHTYNKARAINMLERSGNEVLSAMSNEIRNAVSVSRLTGGIRLGMLGVHGLRTIDFTFVAPTGSANGYIARNGQAITNTAWTTGVNVTHCSFTVNTTARPPLVRIEMRLEEALGAPTRRDYEASVNLVTSVSPRGLIW